MEKDNLKENETTTEEKLENTVHTSNEKNELQDLIEGNESSKTKKAPFGKSVFANLLDQAIVLACSSLIVLIADLVMHIFGYQFVRDTGVVVSVILCMYFIVNCLYVQIMEGTKLKNTIAKRILNL
ncbi:MAG: RDD family protein [Clostridium sp.]